MRTIFLCLERFILGLLYIVLNHNLNLEVVYFLELCADNVLSCTESQVKWNKLVPGAERFYLGAGIN